MCAQAKRLFLSKDPKTLYYPTNTFQLLVKESVAHRSARDAYANWANILRFEEYGDKDSVRCLLPVLDGIEETLFVMLGYLDGLKMILAFHLFNLMPPVEDELCYESVEDIQKHTILKLLTHRQSHAKSNCWLENHLTFKNMNNGLDSRSREIEVTLMWMWEKEVYVVEALKLLEGFRKKVTLVIAREKNERIFFSAYSKLSDALRERGSEEADKMLTKSAVANMLSFCEADGLPRYSIEECHPQEEEEVETEEERQKRLASETYYETSARLGLPPGVPALPHTPADVWERHLLADREAIQVLLMLENTLENLRLARESIEAQVARTVEVNKLIEKKPGNLENNQLLADMILEALRPWEEQLSQLKDKAWNLELHLLDSLFELKLLLRESRPEALERWAEDTMPEIDGYRQATADWNQEQLLQEPAPTSSSNSHAKKLVKYFKMLILNGSPTFDCDLAACVTQIIKIVAEEEEDLKGLRKTVEQVYDVIELLKKNGKALSESDDTRVVVEELSEEIESLRADLLMEETHGQEIDMVDFKNRLAAHVHKVEEMAEDAARKRLMADQDAEVKKLQAYAEWRELQVKKDAERQKLVANLEDAERQEMLERDIDHIDWYKRNSERLERAAMIIARQIASTGVLQSDSLLGSTDSLRSKASTDKTVTTMASQGDVPGNSCDSLMSSHSSVGSGLGSTAGSQSHRHPGSRRDNRDGNAKKVVQSFYGLGHGVRSSTRNVAKETKVDDSGPTSKETLPTTTRCALDGMNKCLLRVDPHSLRPVGVPADVR